MQSWMIVVGSLLALAALGFYWEYRHRQVGWGRGWMRGVYPPQQSYHGYVAPDPWHYHVDVKAVPREWEFDVPLPPKETDR